MFTHELFVKEIIFCMHQMMVIMFIILGSVHSLASHRKNYRGIRALSPLYSQCILFPAWRSCDGRWGKHSFLSSFLTTVKRAWTFTVFILLTFVSTDSHKGFTQKMWDIWGQKTNDHRSCLLCLDRGQYSLLPSLLPLDTWAEDCQQIWSAECKAF